MHFSSLAAFTCLVISASAFDYPEFVPLHRRQEPGTPAYECHANCGKPFLTFTFSMTIANSPRWCDCVRPLQRLLRLEHLQVPALRLP